MSAYGHQMEREYSGQSISSEGGSDLGSRYALEMVYMSSFAATVLIAALVTLGVSLLTLVIALTVMLRSCETRNAGVVEMQRSSYDYDYCHIFANHAELNGLDGSSFPVTCKDVFARYVSEGQYLEDFKTTIGLAESYLRSVTPSEDGNDVVVMDVDDLLPSDFSSPHLVLHRFKHFACNNCARDTKYQKHLSIQSLYLKLRSSGWRLILLSGRSEKLRNATEKYLSSAGCDGWQAVLMSSDDDLQLSAQEYLSKQRIKLHREGYRIVATISSQMDALMSLRSGGCVFKLPNFDLYDNMEHYHQAQEE